MISEAIKDPHNQFMIEAMERRGCPVDRAFFRCVPCKLEGTLGGGFRLYESMDSNQQAQTRAEIIACYDAGIFNSRLMRDMVNHELVHAFDYCRSNLDSNDLKQHACTEIRAANLSRECHFDREFFVRRETSQIRKQHQECVKRRAILSVKAAHPKITQDEAVAAVDNVWEHCFADTEPFERIP
jgi:inner membrane protease ATP23